MLRTGRVIIGMLGCLGCLLLWGCQNSAEPALRRGYDALEQKQFDRALAVADAYLKQSPAGHAAKEAAEAAYLRGRAIEQREKDSEPQAKADLAAARSAYEQALALGPQGTLDGYIRASLANCDYFLQDYPAAERQWLAAYDRLASDPRQVDLCGWLLYRAGVSQQRQGQFAKADQTFELVERRFAGSEAAKRSREHHGAKEFYVQVGALTSASEADKLVAALHGIGIEAVKFPRREANNGILVMAGPLRDYAEATAMHDRLVAKGYKDSVIVP